MVGDPGEGRVVGRVQGLEETGFLGVRGVLRARRWTARHGKDRVQLVVRTIPLLAVLTTVALYPRLAGRLVGGRTVTWETAAYGSAALTGFVLTLLVAALATLTARGWHLAVARLDGPAPT